MTGMEILRRLEYTDMFDSPVPDTTGSNIFGDIEEIEDLVIKRYKRLQSFKLVKYPPSSHKFSNQRLVQGKPLFEKAILKEWKLLRTGLPDSILVRGYRYRYDLMTAVIKGQEGTPYCSNLFFFDIHFPPEYPSRPPQLFFHSNRLDLSPHLRRDGKVLVPLLETPNNGEWNQEHSSILQVLTSIQGLALEAKTAPPPNMDVFESNKKAFLLGCVAILQTLRNPPENFEDFVAGYYRKHTNAVLTIYRANYKQKMENQDEYVIELYWMLIKAFEQNGVRCQYHKQDLPELKKKNRPEAATTNHGILDKIADKVKNLDSLKFYLEPSHQMMNFYTL